MHPLLLLGGLLLLARRKSAAPAEPIYSDDPSLDAQAKKEIAENARQDADALADFRRNGRARHNVVRGKGHQATPAEKRFRAIFGRWPASDKELEHYLEHPNSVLR